MKSQNYKKYFKKILDEDFKYTTAFPLTSQLINPTTKFWQSVSKNFKQPISNLSKQKKAFDLDISDQFIKYLLSYIKKKIQIKQKTGIPIYAYYIISKQLSDDFYHSHILFNIPAKYFDQINNFFIHNTKTHITIIKDERHYKNTIDYVLKKGNLVLNSDDPRLLPTPFNLNVNRKHFE